jgi:hypothetical protein
VTTFGVAWCTHFKRRGLTTYGRLEWSYRAVGLFAAGFERRGTADVVHLSCDEGFEADDFDGTRQTVPDEVDLLYVAAHGELRSHVFDLVLHDSAWQPSSNGLDGSGGPRIVVFDACNLVDHRVVRRLPRRLRVRSRDREVEEQRLAVIPRRTQPSQLSSCS